MKLPEILNIKNAIIIIVIATVVKLILLGLAAIGINFFYQSFPIYGYGTLNLSSSLIIDFATIFIAVRLFNVDLNEQLNKIRLITMFLFSLLAIIIWLLILPLVNPLDFFEKLANHKITIHQYDITIFEKPIFNNIFYFFLMVIITPIIEEILYRGIIFNLLLKKYSVTISLTISSLIFAFVHLRFIGFGYLFLYGMLFGFAYYKTKSILTPIFIHFVINLMAMTSKNQYVELNNTTFSKYFLYATLLTAAAIIVFNSLNKGANSIKFERNIFSRKRNMSLKAIKEKPIDNE